MNNLKAKTHIKTHRCEQLLKGNKDNRFAMAIRYGQKHDISYDKKDNEWWLDHLDYDFDWDTAWMQPICPIIYCPFCGEKL